MVMGESRAVAPADAAASVDDLLSLYDEQIDGLYAFVFRRCGDVELAEDLAQEAFLAAARRFRETAVVPSAGWLYRVARSRLIDHWRREARGSRKLRLLSGGGTGLPCVRMGLRQEPLDVQPAEDGFDECQVEASPEHCGGYVGCPVDTQEDACDGHRRHDEGVPPAA